MYQHDVKQQLETNIGNTYEKVPIYYLYTYAYVLRNPTQRLDP